MRASENKANALIENFDEYGIDAYLIPSVDEYQSEYPTADKQRLKYITGFSGSNGTALIFRKNGLLLTDGRYITQASEEVDTAFFEIVNFADFPTKFEFDKYKILRVGYDPNLFTETQLNLYSKLNLIPVNDNLVDKIWDTKPLRTIKDVYIYDEIFSGRSSNDKISKLKLHLAENHLDYCVITDSMVTCWLLNLRGYESCEDETIFSPMILCKAIVSHEHFIVYVQDGIEKLGMLGIKNVEFRTEEHFIEDLKRLRGAISLDETTCAVSIVNAFSNGVTIKKEKNPCVIEKARKNSVEISAVEEINLIESVILCEAFALICDLLKKGETLTEYQVCKKITELRTQNARWKLDSFPTICGYQKNSAIIHYKPSPYNSAHIKNEGILLIDTGGHYLGGTTDTTRVLALSEPTADQKKRYTQVLMGHIDIAIMRFPKGTSGANIDAIARRHLWADGVDYAHGTGHGVGNFLSVHEGPISISRYNNIPLQPGMVLSNEPGFYVPGQYGIRIENLVYVKESWHENFYEFENLIFVPYCSKLIEIDMLNNPQKDYIRTYQNHILQKVYPKLSDAAKAWVSSNFINC